MLTASVITVLVITAMVIAALSVELKPLWQYFDKIYVSLSVLRSLKSTFVWNLRSRTRGFKTISREKHLAFNSNTYSQLPLSALH